MKNDFPTLLKVFLTDYLQVQRGASMNTVSTYRDAFVGLIEFLSVKKGIRPAAIQMMLTTTNFNQKKYQLF